MSGVGGMGWSRRMRMIVDKEYVVARVRETTGQHTEWLYFDVARSCWYNGSDFVCQIAYWDADETGKGTVLSWSNRHMNERTDEREAEVDSLVAASEDR